MLPLPFIIDTNMFILVALGVILMIALAWVVRLELRIHSLMKGANGRSLEDSVVSSRKRIEEIERFRKELEEYLTVVEGRIKRSVQGVGTIRFNPWRGSGEGGRQSFASAFLDENGNGVVLSSLYARERMSVFAKPIVGGQSEFELSLEEKEAIEKAKKNLL